MNSKQQRFADEYLIDRNGTQAAIRSGYSKKTATAIAYELLHKDDINKYIVEKSQTVADRLGIDANYILRNVRDIADLTKPHSEPNAGVSLKAFETLGKYLKMFDQDDKNKQATVINIQLTQF